MLDSMVEEADACQKNGPYGLKIENVFTKDRMLEFEKAEKYYEEYIPRSKCFTHIALMQNSLCLNLLITLGYEDNEKVRKSMNSIYGLYCEYGGFCISDIKKKYLDAEKRKDRNQRNCSVRKRSLQKEERLWRIQYRTNCVRY